MRIPTQMDNDYISIVRCPLPDVENKTVHECRRCEHYQGEEKYKGLLRWLVRRVICSFVLNYLDV